jgi:DNA (cytosine-5)-methyltransferase 1
MGYHRAGFEVIGVDVSPQPRYPFTFWQLDALTIEPWVLDAFDAIHASPPCQRFTSLRNIPGYPDHPDLIAPTRELIAHKPYVLENVPGSPLRSPSMLCGSMVGLDVRRHRHFETNWPLLTPTCQHALQLPRFANTGTRRRALLSSVVGVYGGSHFKGDNLAYRSAAMEIDWMTMRELSQAIPPAFTELIGWQLRAHLPKPHPPRLRGQTEAVAPEPAPTERSAGSRDAQARERDEVAGGVGQEDAPSS